MDKGHIEHACFCGSFVRTCIHAHVHICTCSTQNVAGLSLARGSSSFSLGKKRVAFEHHCLDLPCLMTDYTCSTCMVHVHTCIYMYICTLHVHVHVHYTDTVYETDPMYMSVFHRMRLSPLSSENGQTALEVRHTCICIVHVYV